MTMRYQLVFTCLLLSCASLTWSQDIEFKSGNKQVALVELYTSQGCSSCPPADEWLGNLKNKPGLWSEFVPVAFHVDYWDFLGWKDSFSKKEYSDRQRLHRRQGNVKVVYTPGFFLNGEEWKRKFGRKTPSLSNDATGNLAATLSGNILKVNYEFHESISPATLNVGILGFGYQSQIQAGENYNRVLQEDFVLLSHSEYISSNHKWEIKLPDKVSPKAKRYGLAIWISDGTDLKPLQATGGWLPESYY
ncbi:MAG: DUF1223 domain-containing protein [Gammaproteobacteria bacterium]|nr:MAG: DUF1223 domain-containing protein [Gammaproteobacteria bacterium]